MEDPIDRYAEMKHKLVVGALLHDIGKLVQRADEKPTSMTHAEFGARWLEDREALHDFAHFARYHHSPGEYGETFLLGFMHLADWLSAGERLDPEHEKSAWEREAILLSIFSKITLDERQMLPAGQAGVWEGRYYELAPASEFTFPKRLGEVRRKGTSENYRVLLRGLEKDLDALGENISVNSLLFLLEKYLSFVPSYTRRAKNDTRQDPDISLFDHCKLTAAVSACLLDYCSERWGRDLSRWSQENMDFILGSLSKYEKEESEPGGGAGLKEEPAFLLTDINLSGIQNFIYNISTKGAAKSLRARSFYLEMLCEDLAQEVLGRCGLERPNILFIGGGRVRILAPNLKAVEVALRDIERDANDFLRRLGGGLSANISWVEMRGVDMVISPGEGSSLPEILEDLSREAELRKHVRPSDELVSGMKTGPFEPLKEECRICHVETDAPVDLAEEGEESLFVCPTCKGLVELGRHLKSRPRHIYIREKGQGVGAHEPGLELPFGFLMWKERPVELRLALVLGDRWSPSSYQGPEYVGFALPAYESAAVTFEELANESVGEARLGVLRMDVDDLGNIFARGIPRNEMSFTRYSVLSRMLNRYFREYIPAVLSGEAEGAGSLPLFERPRGKRRAAEIIYSGGDDLFVVGAWNDLLEAAFDIAACFNRYACENPELHISGGLVVHAHDHPLYRLAQLSEAEEARAKGLPGKNAFCLFARENHWEGYRKAFREILLPLLTLKEGEVAALKPWQSEGEEGKARYYVELPIPKGLLRRLMQLFREAGAPDGKLRLPILCYVLARARERLEKSGGDKWQEMKPVWDKLESSLKDYVGVQTKAIFTAFSCADLLSRGG